MRGRTDDGWMDGRTDAVDGGEGGWVNRQMTDGLTEDGRTNDGGMDGWMDACMHAWIDARTDDGWMDGKRCIDRQSDRHIRVNDDAKCSRQSKVRQI